MKRRAKVLVASIMGNALEFYDYALYAIFASFIATHFFPDSDPTTSFIQTWGAFAAGFLIRPFGATVFGYIGDRYGRKTALSASILLMGLPTFIIGVLPSYHHIGLAAPILLVLCRLLQGLCTGGEYNGAAIFALEHFGKNRPGFIGGLITASCVIGFLAANGLASVSTMDFAPEWFWRVPFILGTSISLTGYFLRKRLVESPDFHHHVKTHEMEKERSPLAILFTDHRRQLFMGTILGGFNGVLSYTLYSYMTTHLNLVAGVSVKQAMNYMLFGLITFMFAAPTMGSVFDRFQNPRNYFKTMAVIIAVCITGEYLLIQTLNPIAITFAEMLAGFFAASIAGPVHAYLQNIFPVEDRYTGVSFSYSLGMSIMGGTTPLVMTYLFHKFNSPLMPAVYTMICAGIALMTLRFLKLPSLPQVSLGQEPEAVEKQAPRAAKAG